MNVKELVIKRLEGATKLTPKEIREELEFENYAGINTLLQELVLCKKEKRYDVYRLRDGEIEVIKIDNVKDKGESYSEIRRKTFV